MPPSPPASGTSLPARGLFTWPASLRSGGANLVLLAAAVLVMTAVGCQDWLFDPLGSLDPYKYVGLFLNYPAEGSVTAGDYKTSRLPWVLPGYASYQLLGPMVGHYVLQITFIVAAAAFLYLALRSLFGSSTALLTAVVFVTCPWLLGPATSSSGGWNYHNTAALTYYFAAFYFLANTAQTRRRVHALLAGVSIALCVFTTVFMAPFLLLLLVVSAGLHRPWRGHIRQVPWILAGGVLATLTMALANVALGGTFFFVVHELRYIAALAHQNDYFEPVAAYAGTAFWLVYPILTLVSIPLAWVAAAWWPGDLTQDQRRTVLLLQAQFVIACVHLVLLSTVSRQSVLQFAFMVVPLAGPMMPALAGFLFLVQRHRRAEGHVFSSVIVVGILVGVLCGTSAAEKTALAAWLGVRMHLPALPAPVLFSLTIGGAALLLVPVVGFFRQATVGAAALFAVINIICTPHPSPLSRGAGCCVNRDAFSAIVDANQVLTRMDPQGRLNRYIYALDEWQPNQPCPNVFLSQVFHSVYASRFSWQVHDWAALPTLTHADFASWNGVTLLTSPARAEQYVGALVESAGGKGISLRVVDSARVASGPFAFVITLLERRGGPDPSSSIRSSSAALSQVLPVGGAAAACAG